MHWNIYLLFSSVLVPVFITVIFMTPVQAVLRILYTRHPGASRSAFRPCTLRDSEHPTGIPSAADDKDCRV